ncbi:MAG: hypothetical protein HGA86_07350 [Anaerolineaceae bacterium]|nr:hypothetical protein [Anaerolineaceae bacterium]
MTAARSSREIGERIVQQMEAAGRQSMVIGVEKVKGMYITYGQERTSKKAIQKMVNVLQGFFPSGETMRIQLLHGKNLEGVALLKEALMSVFDCRFEETLSVAPVLGAHTGGSVVGLAAAPVSVFEGLV